MSAAASGILLSYRNSVRFKRSRHIVVQAIWFGVQAGVNSEAAALANSTAINSACDLVGRIGGGVVELPSGTILLGSSNPTPVNWDNQYAIHIRHSGVSLKGQGIGKTILRLADRSNCHMIKIGSTETGVRAAYCSVENLEIDGNRENQTLPSKTRDHFSGIAVSGWCRNTTLAGLYIHDTLYYGVGMGREGLHECLVCDIDTNNTGADGLDWKNDLGDQVGGIIDSFTARNFGLLPLSNVLTPQAGLDIRSGVHATNIKIYETRGESGLIGIRLQDGINNSSAVQPSRVENFEITGSHADNSIGLRIIPESASAEDGQASGFGDGFSITSRNCSLSKLKATSNGVGFRLWTASPKDSANGCMVSGIIALENNQAGVVCDFVSDIIFRNCAVDSNKIGYDIRSGSTNIQILGGSCNDNTSQLVDQGIRTNIRSVEGLPPLR